MKRLAFVLLGVLMACTQSPEPRTTRSDPNDAPAPSPPNEPSAEAPLEEGHVVFRGMVRPTKGGYEVRGAIVDESMLRKALAGSPRNDPQNADWFLGAMVQIEGELQKHAAPTEKKEDGPVAQTRGGSWLQVTRVDSATIVAPAEVIEGTLGRSKGFFTLAGRLISHHDLEWALAPEGGREGDRVRLFGQPRTVVCEPPHVQCLIGGSLPLFDVGRAERLP
ncbi:hypothetical protein [Polyangium aurulentum]|uniref:hypothetical protein n=1 Tax=Polyangium aurulentum TaxID=2567896 RepID=UPI0010AEB728|nr:hypothetical protein [Polyangium aurulentum]UQA58686.1 hypothetical protein E8A73_046885 [Polyangium aurulentum]